MWVCCVIWALFVSYVSNFLAQFCLFKRWFFPCLNICLRIGCIGLDWFVNSGVGYGCEWCGHPWSWFVIQHPWSWLRLLWWFGCLVKGDSFSVVGGVASSGMVGDGILFNSSSIFWSASISNVPFVFLLSFRLCVRSFNAFTIVSSRVRVGCVMCLCLKYTVSDTLSLFMCFTYITWHQ
jgi:hypothetical protein